MIEAYLVGTYSTQFAKRPPTSHRELRPASASTPVTAAPATLVDLVDVGVLPGRAPVTNAEAACAAGSLALHGAVREVRAGDTDPAARGDLRGVGGCVDNPSCDRLTAGYRDAAAGLGARFEPRSGRSLFMGTYAVHALGHMTRYGTTASRSPQGARRTTTTVR